MTAPRAKLTIPQVIVPFADYYGRHPAWGLLHVVLDDMNTDDASAQACLDAAVEAKDPEAEALARALLVMSPTQRGKLAKAVAERLRTRPVILAPNGHAMRGVMGVESEGLPGATIYDFREIVEKAWPDKTPGEKERQAQLMLSRHPKIARAYRDGLDCGRDLRERSRRGMGWLPWASLKELTPQEVGFVMSKVRQAIGVEQ